MTERAYELADTQAAWDACLAHLKPQPRLAIDIEANSLHAYREQVCLIQISTAERDFIVDPLAGLRLDGLGAILANPKIEKVFHASDYDLRLLRRDFGWAVQNLFDTMWAARILGYANMGLAWFLKEFYGVALSKKHQKADWGHRPIAPELLEYAQLDTCYLLRLRDDLGARLEEAGHALEAREIFANACLVESGERVFDPDDFWSIKGVRTLKPRQQAILRALFILRDEAARQRNKPPFKLINNDVLVTLAVRAPETLEELRAVKGLSPRALDRLGPKLLSAIAHGRRDPVPRRPTRDYAYDPGFAERFERLLEWRKQIAKTRGVESDVIMSREAVKEIARVNPRTMEDLSRIASFGPHRLDLHGPAILEHMA